MAMGALKARTQRPRNLPAEFYASQVDALFSDARSFLVGAVAACASALTVSVRTGSPVVWAIALALGLLCGARGWAMKSYARQRPGFSTSLPLRRWELWYVAGASTHVGLLGLSCLATFACTLDPFDRLLSFATIVAYMVGTPGRNFANSFGVDLQILCGAVPLLAAMTVAGAVYGFVSVIVLVPLFVALKGISARLRGIFVQAVTQAHDLRLLVGRFDTALNNMPHGLAMLDDHHRVLVYNRRLVDLLLLDPNVDFRGAAMAGLLPRDDEAREPASPAREFEGRLRSGAADVFGLEMRNGASLAFTIQAMENGGAVVLAQDVTERKRAEAQITRLALYDPLTHLPNRTNFRGLLESVLARGEAGVDSHALMFVDLDQFKQVNDTLGHSLGDALLIEVAGRLRDVVGSHGTVARFGGDEFVILYLTDDDRGDPGALALALIERVSRPYGIDGHNVVIGASIGIALIPDDGTDADLLLKEADTALYCAKADGRGSWRFFEPKMDVQARARRELEFDLRHALRGGQFEVFYQPIYSLKARRFTVCEALLRWKHPVRGMVSPGEFIPVAEEMGLIVEIGEWVLRQACADCSKWPSDVRVAVNISPLQFRHGGIVPSVCKALADAGLPPQRLELELTESALLRDIAFTRITMEQLHDLKVRFSLDDFGTGYSSLSYLHTLPLSKVKIDRSFLNGLGTSEKTMVMLRGVARLSAELGLSVVIEGVETEHQLAIVAAEENIGEVQGFLFSRPVPCADIMPLLIDSAARAA